MLEKESDSVTNIHRRWTLTRINPSSYRISLSISIFCISIITTISSFSTSFNIQDLLFIIGSVLVTLFSIYLDFKLLSGTPNNKFTKASHVSAFANLLWLITIIVCIAADFIVKDNSVNSNEYLLCGMIFSIGFRIGIYKSVFGASYLRAIITSVVSPVVLFLFVFINVINGNNNGNNDLNLQILYFGVGFVIVGILWAFMADRSGRPQITSTFKILQAFLLAWTENKAEEMEKIISARSKERFVSTSIINFFSEKNHVSSIILPDIHPGPFNPVGGSNLPFKIFDHFSKKGLVMHSLSDHSLNLSTKQDLDQYLDSLKFTNTIEKGNKCAVPIQIKNGSCIVTGISFGNSILLMFSLSPKGMEDLPSEIREVLVNYAKFLGYLSLMIIDCHNAMGEKITQEDKNTLINIGKECMRGLKSAEQYEFKIGFSSSDTIGIQPKEDMGQSGFALLLLEINDTRFFIGWMDSNNMRNEIRDYVIELFKKNNLNLLEICTSDTHSTSGKRNRNGYYTLGDISTKEEIGKLFLELSSSSFNHVRNCVFETCFSKSKVRVMGADQFDDYSHALDKSMKITKVFLTFTFIFFITTVLLI